MRLEAVFLSFSPTLTFLLLLRLATVVSSTRRCLHFRLPSRRSSIRYQRVESILLQLVSPFSRIFFALLIRVHVDALYYWDMLALFPLEYKYVWRSKWTLIKTFYLLK